MKQINYLIARMKDKLSKERCVNVIRLFRKNNIEVGEKCYIYSNIMTDEGYLIKISDNVTISNNVQFITHDNSICKVMTEFSDIFGEIKIGNNCFIGARSIILPGVELNNNIIVAAGSVVSKSFKESNIIIGGNPARKIGSFDQYAKKMKHKGFDVDKLDSFEKKLEIEKSREKLINK